jgi:hypothetical protein
LNRTVGLAFALGVSLALRRVVYHTALLVGLAWATSCTPRTKPEQARSTSTEGARDASIPAQRSERDAKASAAVRDDDSPQTSVPDAGAPRAPGAEVADRPGLTDASTVTQSVADHLDASFADAAPHDATPGGSGEPDWLLVYPESDLPPELFEPFGEVDGLGYEPSTCGVGDAACLRREARDEWLDLAETLGATAVARSGYITELKVPIESSDRFRQWRLAAVGELPAVSELGSDEVAYDAAGRILRAMVDRWPIALHKTVQEYDEEVTAIRVYYRSQSPYLDWSYEQYVDGIETTGKFAGFGTALFDDWRPLSWDVPTPNAPLRAWLERYGPIPDATEAHRSMQEQLRARYPSDYDPFLFGDTNAPDLIDYTTVKFNGPFWLWGEGRRSYVTDYEYWRVVYSANVFSLCEEYLFTALPSDVSLVAPPDAGPLEKVCLDNPQEE